MASPTPSEESNQRNDDFIEKTTCLADWCQGRVLRDPTVWLNRLHPIKDFVALVDNNWDGIIAGECKRRISRDRSRLQAIGETSDGRDPADPQVSTIARLPSGRAGLQCGPQRERAVTRSNGHSWPEFVLCLSKQQVRILDSRNLVASTSMTICLYRNFEM